MPADTLPIDLRGALLSRRGLLRGVGSLAVSLTLADGPARASTRPGTTLDPALPASWITIGADNSITIRSGKPDFGQGTPYTAFRQIVAEELWTRFEAITTVHEGSTDTTPDGCGAFNFLWFGMPNLRKAAAYTFQGLLELAAREIGVPRAELIARDGAFHAGGRVVTYGSLVARQALEITIPVTGNLHDKVGLVITGNPPMKPVGSYTVIGRSFRNSMIEAKVRAQAEWAADASLPGMLHGRVIHPANLGARLVTAGTLDHLRFPEARLFVRGDWLAVVAPTEWQAIQAAEQVAADTIWHDWKGLPGNDGLHDALRTADWHSTPVQRGARNRGDVDAALATAPRGVQASYGMPYVKHAPIGPAMALADVRTDGATITTSSQAPQALRAQIARMLAIDPGAVVVRNLPGAGQFGRSNGGNGGAEDDAVLLSQLAGTPVRVQWMRPQDTQWSVQAAPSLADIRIGLDAQGRMVAYQARHFMPALNDDRLLGAVLAGMPAGPAPSTDLAAQPFTATANQLLDPWLYDRVPHLREEGFGTFQLGEKASPIRIGLRSKSIRTPGQASQNFARELAISEAALLAGADPLQFRLDHTTEPRLTAVLVAARDAAGWDRLGSRRPNASADGDTLHGRGTAVILRHGAYWACACEIGVERRSGRVRVLTYAVAVDPGIVINPMQLRRQVEGGAVMGISRALFEEVQFDESGVTDRDWADYPIMSMSDLPDLRVVLLHRPEVGSYGGGSEAANALAAPAIAAAFLDATGVPARQLPLREARVRALMGARD